MGFISGLWGGHGRNLIPPVSKKDRIDFGRWGPHLSCWNMKFSVPPWEVVINGSNCSFRISIYFCWFRFPLIRISGVRPYMENAARTEIDWYPDLKVGTKLMVLYLSPSFHQTLLRNAVGFTVNDDSSLYATLAHWLISYFRCMSAHLFLTCKWRGDK